MHAHAHPHATAPLPLMQPCQPRPANHTVVHASRTPFCCTLCAPAAHDPRAHGCGPCLLQPGAISGALLRVSRPDQPPAARCDALSLPASGGCIGGNSSGGDSSGGGSSTALFSVGSVAGCAAAVCRPAGEESCLRALSHMHPHPPSTDPCNHMPMGLQAAQAAAAGAVAAACQAVPPTSVAAAAAAAATAEGGALAAAVVAAACCRYSQTAVASSPHLGARGQRTLLLLGCWRRRRARMTTAALPAWRFTLRVRQRGSSSLGPACACKPNTCTPGTTLLLAWVGWRLCTFSVRWGRAAHFARLCLPRADNPKTFTRCGHHFHLQCIYEW